jgi:uncharacterized cofD-like protein
VRFNRGLRPHGARIRTSHYNSAVTADRSPQSTHVSPPWLRALRPGFGIKRWILLLFAGAMLAGLGLALFIELLRGQRDWPDWLHLLTLNFLPEAARVVILMGAGLALALYAAWRFNQTVLSAMMPSAHTTSSAVVSALLNRERTPGPRIVAIGGGTGMPQLLRGLRAYSENITAIVTVADDGGSSGRLRQQMGMLPPGDFRNNIAALSEAEDLMTRLFQYRFAEGEVAGTNGQSSGLAGHSFGNLFITTMAAVTGSFESGIAESSRVLAVRGRILPSTLEQVTLCAEVSRLREDGSEEWLTARGESHLAAAGGRIQRVYLEPESPRAYPAAVAAILQADLIVACPGSFYTSLLPNLLVPSIRDAVRASSAQKIYVCNVATEPGETDHFTVVDHVAQMRHHAGRLFDEVLANDNYDLALPPSPYGYWVTLPGEGEEIDFRLHVGDLVDDKRPWFHDSTKLAARLMELYTWLQAHPRDPVDEASEVSARPDQVHAVYNGQTY